ncbi:hypothetical protein [Aliiruegeria lutimaris]|uniref:Uncharacterized protein n=1 Tax=Aliiruegeria lutimaris TaxID=571298 RepID=A0A1G9DU32_9RHOB|nr:hypothetical protein [Aliiruegeria lutimaris]SDK67356.1 hypothetical protein SAMN04488026_104916 [Aliiruegeria lutimaris]
MAKTDQSAKINIEAAKKAWKTPVLNVSKATPAASKTNTNEGGNSKHNASLS